jgi:hypothetical protein
MPPVTLQECSQPLATREMRRVFLRLHEDIGEALNAAVEQRRAEGETHSDIARKMDCDRAFLTRMLSGQAGTNLRSIAKVLFATRSRLKIELVYCETLKRARYRTSLRKMEFIPNSVWNDRPPVDHSHVSKSVILKSFLQLEKI